MSTPQPDAIAAEFFVGGGEMGALMRSLDWSQTSLGAVQNWSQSLKTAVRIMLTSRQAMFVWWGEDLINLYNDAYCAILGGKHPKALGQPASQVWQEIWDQVGPRAASAIQNNEGTYDEALLLIMERNGYPEETYYTFSYSPIPDLEGGIGGILCANTDDTQRIIGERQLALLKELASTTADARTFDEACTLSATSLSTNPYDLPFGIIYLVDLDQQCAFLAGTSGIEPGHPSAPSAIFLDDPDWQFAEVLRTQQPHLITDLETHFGHLPTGPWQRSPDQLVVVPIAASGKTGKAGILVAGLNPFRLFDDNYQRFLNLVVAQIAASIANAQAYEEERKRAEALAELDRAKTTFFSNISHEFRTPLTLMLSPLEEMLAANDGMPEEQRQPLELVHRNSLRLLKLVNTLLDFSRIEAGRVQSVYEPTDLAAFTAELASVFRSAIEQAGLRFTVACEPLAEPVYIDREMWEKIVLNLLSNAFKFTFEGEICVSLRSLPSSSPSSPSLSSVVLEVRDTGIGISATELPRLFERFHRVEGAQGRTQEGSGIGLALVQELVRLHSGHIQVTSVVGEGTIFTLTIPTGTAHLAPDRIRTTPTAATTALGAAPYLEEAWRWLPEEGFEFSVLSSQLEENTTPAFSSIAASNTLAASQNSQLKTHNSHILLVDDNADMRDYVKRLLLSQGYNVRTATDGMIALTIIQQQIPDLVLTDVMMPRLDGFGLLRELRSSPTTQDIPIILLSARAGEEARVEGLEAGADDYLIKPFSARELLARVEASLKLAQLRRETTRREQSLRLEAEAAQRSVETILSSINDGFYTLDRDWRYTYVNDRLCEIVGMKREEILGRCIWDLFPDTVDTDIDIQFHQAFNEQVPHRFENFYLAWNRWYENRVYPAPQGLTVFAADITDRKQAERDLQESEARFRLVTHAVNGLIFDWNLQTDEVYRSEKLYDLIGVRPEAAPPTSKWWRERSHPDDLARLEPLITDLFNSSNQLYKSEYRVRHEDGSWVTVWEQACLIRDEQGQVLRIVGCTVDISDRKQAEEDLRESERRFRRLVESNMFGVGFGDFSGGIHYVNDYFLNMIGYTREEVEAGQVEWPRITPAEFLPLDEKAMAELRNRGVATPFEKEYIRKDGSRIPILIGSALLQEPYDQQQEIIAFFIDLTEQKQAEAERERLLKQAQAAREEAETANRIKDEFLAVLSHELRSPLNPILGWAKLLQTRPFDEQGTQRALQTIERNAKLQTQLIDDLLDVSRILRGKMALNICPVDLVTVVESALETVRLAAEAKTINLRFTILDSKLTDSDNPKSKIQNPKFRIMGDAARLQQVVWNLLSNAIKFTPDGGQVEVKLESDEFSAMSGPSADSTQALKLKTQNSPSHAQITVSDTGKGISSDFLPYVFDYFRQEDGKTTRKFGGLGLGLAIVRHLTELHGGTLSVQSPGEGQGATFTVRLPLLAAAAEPGEQLSILAQATDLGQLNVLMVDDDEDMRNLVQVILEQQDVQVRTAASATEALMLFNQQAPDILISDIGMPEMDGYMLMQQIRNHSSESGELVPAIALTAYAGEYDQQQAIKAGFQKHISKPVEPETLIQAILELVSDKTLTLHSGS